VVKNAGFGKFMHHREPTPLAKQMVIRMNRDTLYSAAVFDLDAGPVTITLPDPGKRFLSMQVIDEDEYTPEVVYAAGAHTLTKDQIGVRYVIAAIRILVDPSDPKDVAIFGFQNWRAPGLRFRASPDCGLFQRRGTLALARWIRKS
jgi:hypothetical protein